MTKKSVKEVAVKTYVTIENAVVGGYKAIESAVVDGYKAVENATVDSYKSVEETAVNIGKSLMEEYNKTNKQKRGDDKFTFFSHPQLFVLPSIVRYNTLLLAVRIATALSSGQRRSRGGGRQVQ